MKSLLGVEKAIAGWIIAYNVLMLIAIINFASRYGMVINLLWQFLYWVVVLAFSAVILKLINENIKIPVFLKVLSFVVYLVWGPIVGTFICCRHLEDAETNYYKHPETMNHLDNIGTISKDEK